MARNVLLVDLKYSSSIFVLVFIWIDSFKFEMMSLNDILDGVVNKSVFATARLARQSAISLPAIAFCPAVHNKCRSDFLPSYSAI